MASRVEKLIVQLRSAELPVWNTCNGEDRSPEIRISGLLPEVRSLAVFALNPSGPGCSFTSWIIWDIEPGPVIPEGFPREGIVLAPTPAVQGTTDHGIIGYRGPCPPPGETHRYLFKVYGLDAMLDLPAGATKHEVIDAMKGHVLQFGETVAMYGR